MYSVITMETAHDASDSTETLTISVHYEKVNNVQTPTQIYRATVFVAVQ